MVTLYLVYVVNTIDLFTFRFALALWLLPYNLYFSYHLFLFESTCSFCFTWQIRDTTLPQGTVLGPLFFLILIPVHKSPTWPYLYSFVHRTIRIGSILPVNIACAPSTETFKSMLIEAIRTGPIVVAPPRTVTTIHAGVGAREQPLQAFWDGRPWGGIKKLTKIVHRLFLAVAITWHNLIHILLHFIHIFLFYYALILSGFLHYNILTTFHIHVYLFMYDFYYWIFYF